MNEMEIDLMLLELEANGFIRIERDEDGRVCIGITDAGRDHVAELDALLSPCTCDDCECEDE